MSDKDFSALRHGIEKLDEALVKDALAHALSEPKDGAREKPQDVQGGLALDLEGVTSFADALKMLKTHFSFTELEKFSFRGDQTWVRVGSRDIQLTEDQAPEGGRKAPREKSEKPSPQTKGGPKRFQNLEIDQ
jgi:hypothetical protein